MMSNYKDNDKHSDNDSVDDIDNNNDSGVMKWH